MCGVRVRVIILVLVIVRRKRKEKTKEIVRLMEDAEDASEGRQAVRQKGKRARARDNCEQACRRRRRGICSGGGAGAGAGGDDDDYDGGKLHKYVKHLAAFKAE